MGLREPPKCVVIDPRTTATAQAATVHVAPRIGTNVAVLNGLLHLLFAHPTAVDRIYVDQHTISVDELEATVAPYTPEYVEEITGVPAATLRAAAEVIGCAKRLLSTVLQGVYQSNQATAAACQVNSTSSSSRSSLRDVTTMRPPHRYKSYPGHDWQAWLRNLPDERPTNGSE
jgi:ferredoxin-nitrate reductase